MKGVKCPTCRNRFYVSGMVPKWVICGYCGMQFVVERNRTKVRDFIEKITKRRKDATY